jgi:SAM-dependent methyltransferase
MDLGVTAAAETARLSRQLEAWAKGIGPELAFWELWMRTRGHRWPQGWQRRMDPEAPLDAAIARQAQAMGGERLRLLDVGAGPATIVGHRLEGVALAVTATDPLAPLYAALLERHGQRAPVPTRFAVAEDLRLFLAERDFDLVHCRNALDHSFDPLRGIVEMLAMTRPGGRVLLRHIRNEAERENYGGFHQWNFDEADGRFVIWNRDTPPIDVAAALPIPCRVTARQTDMLEVVIERTGEAAPPEADPAGARLACYLEAFVTVLGAEPLRRLLAGPAAKAAAVAGAAP